MKSLLEFINEAGHAGTSYRGGSNGVDDIVKIVDTMTFGINEKLYGATMVVKREDFMIGYKEWCGNTSSFKNLLKKANVVNKNKHKEYLSVINTIKTKFEKHDELMLDLDEYID